MDLKKAMAINVRRERHEKKLSQEELAYRAGISARYLGSIERARVSASVTVLGRLARALRVDACALIRTPHRR
jgi:transcriptional regulator with XRE-family HTH domain